MSDPRNNGTWLVGLTHDPEIKSFTGGRLASFGFALDYAMRDSSNPDKTTAFLRGTYFDDDSRMAKFIFGQIEAGNMKKGSQLIVSGALKIEAWEKDGNRVEKAGIVATGIAYQSGGGKRDDSSEGGSNSGSNSSRGKAIDF